MVGLALAQSIAIKHECYATRAHQRYYGDA
jgi:hypothetical protein